MNRDRDYLQHILEAIEKIEAYTADGRTAFEQLPMAQDAVIRNFEIIGEATKRLSQEIRQKRPDIRWRAVAGFRDVLIHDYEGVDLNEVWNVVQRELPPLKDAIASLLSE